MSSRNTYCDARLLMTDRPNQNNLTSPAPQSQTEKFMRVVFAIYESAARLAERLTEGLAATDERHRRAELLAAYKKRLKWKKADIKALKTLDVNAPARKRMSQLRGRGRRTIEPHESLDSLIQRRINPVLTIWSPISQPPERRKALKLTPWWPHFVEALYRGEHSSAKERGITGASSHAEEVLGKALGISASTVHALCKEIRKMRKLEYGSANFPNMTLCQFNLWMDTGECSWMEAHENCFNTLPDGPPPNVQ